METFINKTLAQLSAAMKANREDFINFFVSVSADSRFSMENAQKIVDYLSRNSLKIGSVELAEGLKVNIDWTALKSEEEVFPEMHKRFHDIHIPTFTEGMFVMSAGETPEVQQAFDETRDIGFYHKPKDAKPFKIEAFGFKFIPAGVYHGPLYGGFEDNEENYFTGNGKRQVVKVCIKILAD